MSPSAGLRQYKQFYRRGAKGGGPKHGCLIFFDFNGHDGADHVGIVESHSDTYVYTIEGNHEDSVKRYKYRRSDHRIFGYGYPIWLI